MNPFEQVWEDFSSIFPTGLKYIADQLSFLGDHRWAAAIVLLTLAVRTLLLPLAVKQIRSMQAMQRLQPELKRLQQKYRNDRQRLNQELMQVYQREGVNPLGGCLPLFAQFPILYAMFFAIRDMSERYGIERMPFLGLGDLTENAIESPAGWLLLAVMTATQLLSTRQMQAASPASQQNKMMQLLPLFFVVVMINFPAGLVLYWGTQNVYQLAQQTIMLRGKGTEPATTGKPQAKGDGKGDGKPTGRPKGSSGPRKPTKSKRKR